MRAVLARNVARALELNRDHIERTAQKVAKTLAGTESTGRLRSFNGRAGK
jgi:DNA-binding GntR family transcriptional regulator